MPTPFKAVLVVYEDGKETRRTVNFNALGVKRGNFAHSLFLVVVKGFGKDPMMLLTSCKIDLHTKESLFRIVEIYLTRWKCDEPYRYIKQCYNLEDIRVRGYLSIRNIVALLLAVSYFAAVYLGDNLRLKLVVERIFLVSKRFFGIRSFFNYAIADGIYNLLFPDKTALRHTPVMTLDDFQLAFEFG